MNYNNPYIILYKSGESGLSFVNGIEGEYSSTAPYIYVYSRNYLSYKTIAR